jgi:hypothetical protein
MTKRLSIFLLQICALCLPAVNSFAAEKIPAIQSIIIMEAGIESRSFHTKEPPGACKDYALSLADVREFLAKAKVVDTKYDYLPKSRCWTTVKMTTQDGKKVGMIIERSRRGSTFTRVENKISSETLSLYCSECRNKKFYDAKPIPSNAEVEAQRQAIKESIVNMLAKGDFKADEVNAVEDWKELDPTHYIPSFETELACKDFNLTAKNVEDFFKNSRLLSNPEEATGSGHSRCIVKSPVVLQDGKTVYFEIDKARNGSVLFSDNPEGVLNQRLDYFCENCKNEKFYPPEWKATSNRPIVKNVTFTDNGAWSETMSSQSEMTPPEGCKDFLLTEEDVREFFNVARPSHSREFMNELDASCCFAAGTAVLQDGREATWLIDRFRRGSMYIRGGSPLYYYGAQVNSPLYYEACDIDCIRGEETR